MQWTAFMLLLVSTSGYDCGATGDSTIGWTGKETQVNNVESWSSCCSLCINAPLCIGWVWTGDHVCLQKLDTDLPETHRLMANTNPVLLSIAGIVDRVHTPLAQAWGPPKSGQYCSQRSKFNTLSRPTSLDGCKAACVSWRPDCMTISFDVATGACTGYVGCTHYTNDKAFDSFEFTTGGYPRVYSVESIRQNVTLLPGSCEVQVDEELAYDFTGGPFRAISRRLAPLCRDPAADCTLVSARAIDTFGYSSSDIQLQDPTFNVVPGGVAVRLAFLRPFSGSPNATRVVFRLKYVVGNASQLSKDKSEESVEWTLSNTLSATNFDVATLNIVIPHSAVDHDADVEADTGSLITLDDRWVVASQGSLKIGSALSATATFTPRSRVVCLPLFLPKKPAWEVATFIVGEILITVVCVCLCGYCLVRGCKKGVAPVHNDPPSASSGLGAPSSGPYSKLENQHQPGGH